MSFLKDVEHLQIPLQDIILATNNFSEENFIGQGGFGKVYKGKLSRSECDTVAIKRLYRGSGQGDREFVTEVALLSSYRHENIVSLVGFCDENLEKILIYEHASNGSLDKFVASEDLTWIQRLQICIDAANGLKYLHHDVGPQHRVIHRDLKSSNILLDENWKAKISDFGLSKVGPANVQFTFLITTVCGTIGYVDPVYLKTGMLTKESDVYSFGVILFEVMCGRLSCIEKYHDERRFLGKLAKHHYEKETLDEIIDPNLRKQMNSASLSTFSTIAYQCLKKHREERPIMNLVVEELVKALDHQQLTVLQSIVEEEDRPRETSSGSRPVSDEISGAETDVAQWNVLQVNTGSTTPFIIKCGANSQSELVIKADARVQEPKGGEIVRVVPRPTVLENMSLEEMKEVFSKLPEALSLLALARTADGIRARYSRLYRTLAMKVPALRDLVGADTDVAQWHVLQFNTGSTPPFIIKCGANSQSELVVKADTRVQEPKGGEIVRVVPRPTVLENMSLEEMKEVFSKLPEALSLLALARTADGTGTRYSRLYRTLAMKVPALRDLVGELEKSGGRKEDVKS